MSEKQVAQKAQQVFVLMIEGERHFFDSQQDADDFQRNPMIQTALSELVVAKGAAPELAVYLFDNKESIESCFSAGKARKVTRKERGELERALKAVIAEGNPDFAFLATHAEIVKSSFSFPAKRMSEDDRKLLAKKAVVDLVDNANLSDWINANMETLKEAYAAGQEKKVISDGLKQYQEKVAAQRAAKAALAV